MIFSSFFETPSNFLKKNRMNPKESIFEFFWISETFFQKLLAYHPPICLIVWAHFQWNPATFNLEAGLESLLTMRAPVQYTDHRSQNNGGCLVVEDYDHWNLRKVFIVLDLFAWIQSEIANSSVQWDLVTGHDIKFELLESSLGNFNFRRIVNNCFAVLSLERIKISYPFRKMFQGFIFKAFESVEFLHGFIFKNSIPLNSKITNQNIAL